MEEGLRALLEVTPALSLLAAHPLGLDVVGNAARVRRPTRSEKGKSYVGCPSSCNGQFAILLRLRGQKRPTDLLVGKLFYDGTQLKLVKVYFRDLSSQ